MCNIDEQKGWQGCHLDCMQLLNENPKKALVYVAGPAGSKCTTGRNPKFTGPCDINEEDNCAIGFD